MVLCFFSKDINQETAVAGLKCIARLHWLLDCKGDWYGGPLMHVWPPIAPGWQYAEQKTSEYCSQDAIHLGDRNYLTAVACSVY